MNLDLDILFFECVCDQIELKPNDMVKLKDRFGTYSFLETGKEGTFVYDPDQGIIIKVAKSDVFIVVQNYTSKFYLHE